MFTIIRIDYDEANHRVLNKWFSTEKEAYEALTAMLPAIRANNPGSELNTGPEPVSYFPCFLTFADKVHTAFHVIETDREEDFV